MDVQLPVPGCTFMCCWHNLFCSSKPSMVCHARFILGNQDLHSLYDELAATAAYTSTSRSFAQTCTCLLRTLA